MQRQNAIFHLRLPRMQITILIDLNNQGVKELHISFLAGQFVYLIMFSKSYHVGPVHFPIYAERVS